MPRATPVLREKVVDERRGEEKPTVLYDNHSPKGHHRHVEGVEEPYSFSGIDQLLADFRTDVRRITGDDTWPRS